MSLCKTFKYCGFRKKKVKVVCDWVKLGNSEWWTRGFSLKVQESFQEVCESLNIIVGKFLSVFTLIFFFFPGGVLA